MNLQNLIKRYLKETALQQSPATLRNYTTRLAAFQSFVEQNSLKYDDRLTVMQWQRSLLDGGLKNSTVQQYMVELKTFFKWAVEQGHLNSNPSDGIKMPKADAAKKEFLTMEEADKLLAASTPPQALAHECDYTRNWTMLLLILTTGIRLDSLCRLRIQDIDFKTGFIHLDKAKGGKSYDIPAPVETLHHIQQYIKRSRPRNLLPEAPLFLRRLSMAESEKKAADSGIFAANGHKYAAISGPNFSSRICTKYTKAICGHAVTAHELRHSTAMYLLEKNMPIQVIQEQLGHNSIIITQRYLHGLKKSTLHAAIQSAWGTPIAMLSVN